jgi:hypothetical protein
MKVVGSLLRESDNADAFASGGGGGLTIVSVDLDFTAAGARSKTFSVANGAAVTTSKVLTWVSGSQPVAVDELEMDPIMVVGRCQVDGTVLLTVISINGGMLRGQRRVLYALA